MFQSHNAGLNHPDTVVDKHDSDFEQRFLILGQQPDPNDKWRRIRWNDDDNIDSLCSKTKRDRQMRMKQIHCDVNLDTREISPDTLRGMHLAIAADLGRGHAS